MFDSGSGDETARENRRRLNVMIGLVVAAGVLIGIAAWWMRSPAPSRPDPESTRVEAPSTPPREETKPPPEPPSQEAAPEPRRRARSAPAPRPEPAPVPVTPAPPTRELIVRTDVEGALVFLDRKFIGNAPVRTADVEPGSHRLNVSAQGFDGVSQSVEVAAAGPTEVTVRLKDVRLNETVEVVHKHGMGSCKGRLTARLSGFAFVPERGNDGFTLPLDALDAFEIDYLKNNLRLKQKQGKTWNFESANGTADPIFVFHRDVEKARARLAAR